MYILCEPIVRKIKGKLPVRSRRKYRVHIEVCKARCKKKCDRYKEAVNEIQT